MIYPTRLASMTLPSEVNHSKFAKLNLTDGETLHAKLVVCSFLPSLNDMLSLTICIQGYIFKEKGITKDADLLTNNLINK